MIFGYNVARFDALIEGHTIAQDALYTAVGAAVVAAFYGLVTLALLLSGHFILAASYLDNAHLLQVSLPGSGAPVQYTIFSPGLLGLNIIYVRDTDGGTGDRPTRAQVNFRILNYLRAAYPVSNVLVLGERSFDWDHGPRAHHYWRRLLHKLWRVYGGDDASGHYSGPEPIHSSVLGVVTEMPHSGCCGGGYAFRWPERRNVAVTTLYGDTAAQEIGHNLGFKHLSNDHGESSGGTWELSPYPHGTSGHADRRQFGTLHAGTLQ